MAMTHRLLAVTFVAVSTGLLTPQPQPPAPLGSDPDTLPAIGLTGTTWRPRPDGTIRQTFESSTDGGKTWGASFDRVYTIAKGSSRCSLPLFVLCDETVSPGFPRLPHDHCFEFTKPPP